MPEFAEAADRLVQLGYHIFQCQPRSKIPFGITAPNGCKSASDNPAVVHDWWTRFPDCNIGLRCDNVLVIDVDNKNGKDGSSDFLRIAERIGAVGACPINKSGNGGYHLLFQKPNVEIKSSKGLIWDGKKTSIDVQVGNQYIVVPPSIHPETGKEYFWKIPPCRVSELSALPDSWIQYVLQHKPTQTLTPILTSCSSNSASPVERCLAYVSQIPPSIAGQGGDLQLYKTACAIFWDFGLSESDGMPVMREFNARCLPPWSDARLVYKMNQTFQAPHDLPRGHKLEERQTPQTHNVDLSEFSIASVANNSLEDEPEINEKIIEVPPIPNELLRIPGFIGEVMDFCLENSSYPIPAMAFGGALALQSFLCGRKIREPGDLRTNLYLLALANASSGKDYARKVIKAVAREIGASYGIGDKFASGQAIEDSLLLNPNLLFLSDEFDAILSSIKKGKETSNEMIVSTLLTLYTSANTYYDRRRKADVKKIEQISQPHLSIFGTATPKNYYSALSGQMLEGGLFARMIVLDAGKRPKGQDTNPPDCIVEHERIIDAAKWWYEFDPGGGNLSHINPTPHIVPFDDSARDVLRDYRVWTEDEYSKSEEQGDCIAMTVWGRAAENATKLALLAACSEQYKEPIIRSTHTRWAVRFNDHQVRRALFLASEYAAETEFDAKIKKAMQELRKLQPEDLLPEWKLRRRLGLPPNEFDMVVSDLARRKLAVFESVVTKGRPHSGFRLL
ncbi:MAG: bifunctional DNA primase/polymerase [Planctomycetaceae bacterium]|nr:bifunctional DNA primase/polymerase [Planctomycetaceae bacterium]